MQFSIISATKASSYLPTQSSLDVGKSYLLLPVFVKVLPPFQVSTDVTFVHSGS